MYIRFPTLCNILSLTPNKILMLAFWSFHPSFQQMFMRFSLSGTCNENYLWRGLNAFVLSTSSTKVFLCQVWMDINEIKSITWGSHATSRGWWILIITLMRLHLITSIFPKGFQTHLVPSLYLPSWIKSCSPPRKTPCLKCDVWCPKACVFKHKFFM